MRICNCENPSYLRNKYTGEMLAVPCGKCDSCKNQRAKTWIDRISQEVMLHKYCYMANLTYDDDHLPKLMLDDDFDHVSIVNRSSDRIAISDIRKHMKANTLDYKSFLNDWDLFWKRLAHPLGIPVVYTKDISDFCKRFNKYCFKHITHHYENFRYFCCHEYGPTTYRCHAHMLFFFDEDAIAGRFEEILCSCWQLGDCRAEHVYSSGAYNYVAQYVSMSTHLPSFCTFPKFRPRPQFSKFPSIGSPLLLDEKVREVYNILPTRRSVWDSRHSKYVDLPVSPSFKNRYFPKFKGYLNFSHFDRVTLYRTCELIPAHDFEEFKKSLLDVSWLVSRQIQNSRETLIYEFYRGIEADSDGEESLRNSLYRWFATSKLVINYSRLLSRPVDYVVSKIEEFYNKIEYERLVSFYQWQQNYTKNHSARDLLCAYPEFYHLYKDISLDDLSDLEKSILETFDIYYDSEFPSLENTADYLSMKSQALKIYKDTHKAHEVNSYLYGQKLKSLDPKLQTILISYSNGKK